MPSVLVFQRREAELERPRSNPFERQQPGPVGCWGDLDSFPGWVGWYPLVALLIGLLAGVFDLLPCWLLPMPGAGVMLLAILEQFGFAVITRMRVAGRGTIAVLSGTLP